VSSVCVTFTGAPDCRAVPAVKLVWVYFKLNSNQCSSLSWPKAQPIHQPGTHCLPCNFYKNHNQNLGCNLTRFRSCWNLMRQVMCHPSLKGAPEPQGQSLTACQLTAIRTSEATIMEFGSFNVLNIATIGPAQWVVPAVLACTALHPRGGWVALLSAGLHAGAVSSSLLAPLLQAGGHWRCVLTCSQAQQQVPSSS
jgi:hypothetical protein